MFAVRYFVDDVDDAVTFYEAALDFYLVEQFGRAMAVVRRADQSLWLAGPLSSAARALADNNAYIEGGSNRIVLMSGDIETERRAIEEYGGCLVTPPTKGPNGTQMIVEDPFGNHIELYQSH